VATGARSASVHADAATQPGRPLRRFFHPIAPAEDVTRELKSFRLLGEDVLVFRNAAGEPLAFKDLCIHRGTRLSLGELTPEGNLRCGYHGWEYDEAGVCVRIPALREGANVPRKARAVKYYAAEAYDVVWVALDEPLAGVPGFPEGEWDAEGWRGLRTMVQTWHSSAGRVIENFCDWAHLPWVHENVLGTRDNAQVEPHDIWQDDLRLGFTIEQEEPLAPDYPYSATRTSNTFTVELPFTVHLDQGEAQAGGKRTIVSLAAAPISPDESRLYLWSTRNHSLEPENDRRFIEFAEVVLEQDRRVVESQRPEQIPLSLREELHLKVPDAFALVYRRLLAEFGDDPFLGE
jgi:phenylpropionate dioxygenase-like ring-hydroxylating dioxygenase large terminal subunit